MMNVSLIKGNELESSVAFCGFPTNSELFNPATVDKLINAGKVKNYSLEGNKIEKIPLFIPTLIDTTDSAIKGNFYIHGGFLTEFTLKQSFNFEIFLMTGEKAICTFPKINLGDLEIQIECVLQQELIDSKIMIQKYSILDGYTEIIRLNRIATEKEVYVANGKLIEEIKSFDVSLSFAQMNGFKTEENIIIFIFIGFTIQSLIY